MVKARFKKWDLRKYCTKRSKETTVDGVVVLEHLEAEETDHGLEYSDFDMPQGKLPLSL